ncbi:hypothetical protein [uncultured Bacteroides sp.]
MILQVHYKGIPPRVEYSLTDLEKAFPRIP